MDPFLAVGGIAAALLLLKCLRPRRRSPSGSIRFAGEDWEWSRLCRHLLVMGGTGSGKTYSTNFLMAAIMRAGCPMLITAVKLDDAQRIRDVARKAGQLSRLVEITPSGPHRFELIESLLRPHGSAEMASELIALIGDVGGDLGAHKEAFWRVQGRRQTAAALTLSREVDGKATVLAVHEILMSTPGDLGKLKEPEWRMDQHVDDQGREIGRGACAGLIYRGYQRNLHRTNPAFLAAVKQLTHELPGAGDRMRGGVLAEASNSLGSFTFPPYDRAFSGGTTLTARDIEEQGLIAVLNSPVTVDMTPARRWQFCHALEMQRYCMARDAHKVARPFVLWRDEAGFCLNPKWDASIQLVARSQKLATIDICQDTDTLQNQLGGDEVEARSFCSNHTGGILCFGTQNFATAKWMSGLLGQRLEYLPSGGGQAAPGPIAGGLGVTIPSFHPQYVPAVRPEVFHQLPVGRCVVVEGGRYRVVDVEEE